MTNQKIDANCGKFQYMPQNQSPTNKVKRWALGKSSLKFGHSDKATKI